MSSAIAYDLKEHVATIRLQRPEVLNALNRTTLAEFVGLVAQANTDPGVRALIVTGGPDAFCTGEDLREVTGLTAGQFREQIVDFQRLASGLRNGPKPTIAAIGGPAIGGGIELAVNCDVRIAATNASIMCPELRWGLTVTNGSSVLLRRIVGESWAREMLLFGTRIDANTALRIGLVSRLVSPAELEQAAWEMARTVADHSADALALTKQMLNADPAGWQQTLDAETDAVTAGFTSQDVQARLASFNRHRTQN